jgi:DNA-directed RNA polymerase subunit beta'
MAHLDHEAAYADFKDRALEGVKAHFPIQTPYRTVELNKLEVQERGLHPDDIRSQLDARLGGKTWASTLFGDLSLKDTQTGKVIDRRKIRLAELPRVTRRRSFIVDGKEYQVDNQWQLKPGIYSRRSAAGQIEAHFNVPNKREFDITFDPAKKQFMMKRGTTKAIPIYPLMKTLGVDDDVLERDWGPEIFRANKEAKGLKGALAKFFKVDRRRQPKTDEEAETYFRTTMEESILRPDATVLTTGKPYENVTGDAMRVAANRLLKIQAGGPEDDRDSIIFKDLRTVGDFAYERLTDRKVKNELRKRVTRKFFKAGDLRDLIKYDMFNVPIRQTFTKNSGLASHAAQVNPVSMLAGAQQTTIMGAGGIQSQDAIDNMVDAKFINPSHMGYLDPVRTPESEKSGVVLRLPMGVRKVGKEPAAHLYNLKTGRVELVPPSKFFKANVVLPDQVTWKDEKPVPLSARVKASGPGNVPAEVSMKDAQYVMRHPSQMFSITTNLIPFLGNNSGNRATYATQQIEQAISLKGREAPHVQVSTGVDQPGLRTFEELIGRQASHASTIDGTVTKVKDDAVVVKGPAGVAEIQLYNNFPLNDPKAMLHSEPTVKVGDKVKRRQSVADSNFTRSGALALGTNLRVAYIPYKGYNFEDGVVISKSAAEKLTSVHMHKPELRLEKNVVTDPRRFKIQHIDTYSKDQFSKVDDAGVVRVGQSVQPGDPLVLAMRPYQLRDRMSLQHIGKALSGRQIDASLKWTSDYPGKVVAVHKGKDKIAVHVRTDEPMQIGDKLTGRHGNKGIVTRIMDNGEMPRTPDGKHVEVALNPVGVVGRMNIGQVLETAASKIAEKTGRPYIVDNFANVDQLAKVKKELKDSGLSDQEELFDPTTGLSMGKALVGPQYMLKLMQQIDKKNSVRSGMALPGGEEDPELYDRNLLPASGGSTGGQSVGALDMYALLAHGAKANIREMQTWKSEGPDVRHPDPAKQWPSQHDEVWDAMQLGHSLPTPRPTFSFRKFEDMLRAAGVNTEKKGHHLQLVPMTDRQILNMSSGEIKKPGEIVYPSPDKFGEPKPIKGGLFDVKVTGGHGGKKWAHISLAESLPNPIFEKAIQRVTGLREKDYLEVVHGNKALDKEGNIVELGVAGTVSGGPAIVKLLEKIDVAKDLKTAEEELSKMTLPAAVAHKPNTQKVDNAVKRVKTLRALNDAKLSAKDAYVLKNLPVIPPTMRAPSMLPNGNIKPGDLNQLYKNFGHVNTTMKDPELMPHLDDEGKKGLRTSLYDGVRALMGVGVPYADQEHKGILHQIAGKEAKTGYFQKTLMSRRQDMSMRSTIIPEPALDLDEVGLPRNKALTLFKPFVVKKLVDIGAAKNVLEARDVVMKKGKAVDRALDLVVQERPILLKRDPVLHKHSVQAFKPKLVGGKAIRIHPLVTSGYNADFDGDQMSAYVPIHPEAVEEARRMMPSNNLFNEASGHIAVPTKLESSLGLYKLSRVDTVSNKKFKSAADALEAVNKGKLSVNEMATIGGTRTTAGRVLLASALPEDMQKDVLANHKQLMDKNGIQAVMREAALRHKSEFGDIANRLKDIGNGAASGAVPIFHGMKGPDAIKMADGKKTKYVTVPVHSFSLDDFTPDVASRDPILRQAKAQADMIMASPSVPKGDKDRRVAELWTRASEKMTGAHLDRVAKKPNNLVQMVASGTKPSLDQYRQMVLSPVLMEDAAGRPILQPIMKSYAEGLDLGSYWTQQQGARRGTVMKVQEVRDPGTFSKRMIQTTMNLVVTGDDCGTDGGVSMNIGDSDVYDRMLAKDFSARGVNFSAGTVLTPDVVTRIRSADKSASVILRSPLKCEHGEGLCKKCAGLKADGKEYELGTNVGILASQAMGERSTQLSMKAFHTGGVRTSGGAKAVSEFDRVEQLTYLPKDIPDATVLAMKSGKVEKIEHDPTGVKVWIGGEAHHVGKDKTGMPLHVNLPNATKYTGYKGWRPPKVGTKVNAGEPLSDPNRTVVNPRDLYKATNNMEKVQNFLVDELSGIYGRDVRRQHVEAAVKAMSNLTKVRDPGDGDVLLGEFQPVSQVRAENRRLIKEGKTPIEHSPVMKGIDQMPLAIQEDWMAKLQHTDLRNTLLDAAALGARSNLHGVHPVPGAAYGAEFGLTSEHALKPGLARLKDVPRYAY